MRATRAHVALSCAALLACDPSAGRQATISVGPSTPALPAEARVALAEAATTRLDVEPAGRLLAGTGGPRALLAKARLALYTSDCEAALFHLSSATVQGLPGSADLRAVASACHGATTGGVVHEDTERGIWIRVQDEADGVLVPFLVPVIDRARQAIGASLGVDLPRPLRLELVRDLFSLAAVSGLPLEAAETTGTVAVARWGKVTMLSPRATTGGYPWADTLAHELTHLMLSRASSDRAPLWLQEGVAKNMETHWRQPQAFDGRPDPDEVVLSAALSGHSVGVTKLGPSIAMLPSAHAARVAFAEVSSFMDYWTAKNGPHALPVLLRDLAIARDADSAMRSVSGLGVADWEILWRDELGRRVSPEQAMTVDAPEEEPSGAPEIARNLRVAELLYAAGHTEFSSERARADVDFAPHVAALRYAAARGLVDAERRSEALGTVADVDGPHGGWLALSAAQHGQGQSSAEGRALEEQAISLDPLQPDVACAGTSGGSDGAALDLRPELKALCDHVRALPSRTAR